MYYGDLFGKIVLGPEKTFRLEKFDHKKLCKKKKNVLYDLINAQIYIGMYYYKIAVPYTDFHSK